MPNFVNSLANVLTISALVGIFVSLRRQNRSPRFALWLFGWSLILLHFLAECVPSLGRTLDAALLAVRLSALGLCGLAFLVSVSDVVNLARWRNTLLVGLGSLISTYCALLAFGKTSPAVMIALASLLAVGGSLSIMLRRRTARLHMIHLLGIMAVFGGATLWRCVEGDYAGCYFGILLVTYAMCATLTTSAFRTTTTGAIVTAVGFFAWSSIWAVGLFFPNLLSGFGRTNSIYDVPKLLVAFGMIMIELERRTAKASAAEQHERELGQQLSKFSAVTTHLLAGADVQEVAGEVAQTITEIANFRRAVIVMADDAGRLFLVGYAGLKPEAEDKVRDAVSRTTIEDIELLCTSQCRIGNDSVICSRESVADLPRVASAEAYEPNPYWRAGDEVIVPMRTSAGNLVGCISLDEPADVKRVNSQEMYSIEMLARHLGVAIEKASLQRKVILREKLASIGQLVGGVAHELNNPLTAVIGYSDLLADADVERRFDREISTLRREARRMRVIIDNLLRFARQSKVETTSASMTQAIEEALALREYEFSRRGVILERDVTLDLPAVAIDEAQLKSVIVNLLNNAYDAVEKSEEKRVQVFARRVADRVLLSVIDSGSGFSDVSRAFDPFFSTKGVGRGSGLGLSICYGIVKQHGGEIYAQNVQPQGACVTIELKAHAKADSKDAETATVVR